MSMLQLLVSGSLVGILFSLIAIESGNIWNSALVHGIWNMAMAGGILHIGKVIDSQVLYNWVLNTDETLWTGGEFGAEASLIAITVYLLVIGLHYGGCKIRQKLQERENNNEYKIKFPSGYN